MYWYNGELINSDTLSISINEPALLYGATIFTTLRVYEQSLLHPLTHWTAHCQRLQKSLTNLGWQPPNWQQIETGVIKIAGDFPVVRITIFPDGKEWIIGRNLPPDLAISQQQGIQGWVADNTVYSRSLPHHKTGSYLGAWLARQQAFQEEAKEAILIDLEGNWLETSTGNLWGWQNGYWWTPPLNDTILPGVIRSHLIQWLESQNIPVKQEIWTPDLVVNFEAIAYSNSAIEIIPFSTIKNREADLSFNYQHFAFEKLRSYFI